MLLVLLFGVAVVLVVIGDVIDGVIISVIVVLSIGFGFVNEYWFEVVLVALHDGIWYEVLVWRDGVF